MGFCPSVVEINEKEISIEMTIGQMKQARMFIFKLHFTLYCLIEREFYPCRLIECFRLVE